MIKIINQYHDDAQIMMVANKVRNEEIGESLFYKMNLNLFFLQSDHPYMKQLNF